MYEDYFGLSSKPFQLNPDPSFYFGSTQHRRAKAYLEYGVRRNEGFIVITGEVGAGKTTIVRGLLESLDPNAMMAVQLVSTQLGADDTLRMVGAAFGVPVKGNSKAELLMALEAYLITQATLGKRCLLIVDEAQNLDHHAVEELRMLSNFQYGKQALLQTFLIGQPEFRDILQSPNMLQLRQRVTATCHIGPMDVNETRAYIEHRLKRAGATDKPSFDDAVFPILFEASAGIPRRINGVCDRLLLHGFLSEKTHFAANDAQEVVDEMKAEMASPPSRVPDITLDDIQGDTEFSAVLADGLLTQIERLAAEQYNDRLNRIERSMLRQERVNIEILAMLQKLVIDARSPKEPS